MKYRYYFGSGSSRWKREFLFDNLSISRSPTSTKCFQVSRTTFFLIGGDMKTLTMVNALVRCVEILKAELPKIGDSTRPAYCRNPRQGDGRGSVFLLVEHVQCRDNADKPRCQRHLEEEMLRLSYDLQVYDKQFRSQLLSFERLRFLEGSSVWPEAWIEKTR